MTQDDLESYQRVALENHDREVWRNRKDEAIRALVAEVMRLNAGGETEARGQLNALSEDYDHLRKQCIEAERLLIECWEVLKMHRDGWDADKVRILRERLAQRFS